MSVRKVLFLCTGNSARSQMAEGLVNRFRGESWEAVSAGTRPSGYVHPLAMRAMDELGIDISDNQSKSTDAFRDAKLDLVITVCDDAAKHCPAWLGEGRVVHMAFPDPAAATGSEEERMALFRQVRDGIRARVFEYLDHGYHEDKDTGLEVYFAPGNP
jgi:arsenate reductase